MGLMSRDDYEQEIRRLDRRQSEFARLLVTCVHCGAELQGMKDSFSPEVMEDIFRGRAYIGCDGCGKPRVSMITADEYAIASRELERQKQHARNQLVMTGVTIADAKKTLASGRFAWVIGARKEHERGCRKVRDPQARFCSCDGVWKPVSKKGIRIRCGGKNWVIHLNLLQGLQHIAELEHKGVTVMEYVFREKSERDAKPEPETYPLAWQLIPIEELPVYAARDGWMIRYPMDKATATHFEACEVGA